MSRRSHNPGFLIASKLAHQPGLKRVTAKAARTMPIARPMTAVRVTAAGQTIRGEAAARIVAQTAQVKQLRAGAHAQNQIINKLRAEKNQLSAKLQTVQVNKPGADAQLRQQLNTANALVVKLRGDVTHLTNRVREISAKKK